MPAEPRPVTPTELRNHSFKTSVRGYDRDAVAAMFERAASMIEQLLANPKTEHLQIDLVARELRNADLAEGFRGYDRDEVNALAERAAATVQALRPSPPAVPTQGGMPTQSSVPNVPAEASVANVPSVPRATSRPPLVGSGSSVSNATREAVRVGLGSRTYHVVIGTHLASEAVTTLHNWGARRATIITQPAITVVAEHYANELQQRGIESHILTIADGEAAKSLATVDDLCRQMVQRGMLRGDAVLAVGGGVVGDLAGFTAAVHHRGIAVLQVPTTLLAMVDAAIGGKTAANLPEGKNLVGAFHQPIGVLCDPTVLGTLPDREFRCGLGEVVKYALMGDGELLTIVEHEAAALLAREPDVLRRAIPRSASVKARFVSADEHERTGLREHLNYGHTLAHALEIAGNHALAHGEAVAIGLVFAGALAGALERISPDAARRHHDLVGSLGLPVSLPNGATSADLVALMMRDKKAVGGLRFVLQGPNGLERVDDPDPGALAIAFAAVGIGV